MNYELAKQLKDAGFPDKYTKDCKCLPVLSLSNLIDACGKMKFELWRSQAGWGAKTMGRMITGVSTPEEAVARLWLALHTEKQSPP
jgi:hypothetical protein